MRTLENGATNIMNKIFYILIAVLLWSVTLGSQVAGRLAQCYLRGDEWWRLMQELGFGLGFGAFALIMCIFGAITLAEE